MAFQVNEMLIKYGRIIAWVVANLHRLKMKKIISTMTVILTFFVSCEVLGLVAQFVRSCGGPFTSKCCQHAIDDSEVCVSFTLISIKET